MPLKNVETRNPGKLPGIGRREVKSENKRRDTNQQIVTANKCSSRLKLSPNSTGSFSQTFIDRNNDKVTAAKFDVFTPSRLDREIGCAVDAVIKLDQSYGADRNAITAASSQPCRQIEPATLMLHQDTRINQEGHSRSGLVLLPSWMAASTSEAKAAASAGDIFGQLATRLASSLADCALAREGGPSNATALPFFVSSKTSPLNANSESSESFLAASFSGIRVIALLI